MSAPSAALWKQGAERFPELGQPDKFFGDRSQSEWMSFTITTNTQFLLEEIEAITGQPPGNALKHMGRFERAAVDRGALAAAFHAQQENEGVIWGYCLYPRRAGDFVKKPFIEMTGREILGELAAIDTRDDGIARHRQQILDSVVNVVPVLMPYASALFNRRAVGDRPLVVPKRSKNLAFISQFAELPYDMVFTEQYSVRCAQVAAYHFLGFPGSRLTKINRYDRDPRVLLKATQAMFR